jgi:lipoprotein-releasing system permease protein
LNLEFFIAKRLVSGKESKGFISRSLVHITTFGISLGLAVMIISVAIVTGFKKQITDKVIGFGGHIQIEYLDNNASFETKPISSKQEFIPEIKKIPGITNIQKFAIKAGIIKTKEDFQGVVLKGVDTDFDWSFFKNNLLEGKLPAYIEDTLSNEILISKSIAKTLKLSVGEDVALYFIQDPVRFRRMKITGIYSTGLEEFDKIYVVADIKQIQRLNDWQPTQISGFEININNFKKIEETKADIHPLVSLTINKDGSALRTTSIIDKYPQIFDWLNLQNMNVWVILAIMLVVASLNMASGLLILILERTKMIGLLTSLGAQNYSIRLIFLYQSAFLTIRGLFWGNLIGLGTCFLQYKYKLMKLDQASYFIDSVPINFNVLYILLLNFGTLAIVMIVLLLPSMILSKISPDITLRYN